ncbi:PAS domain S-box protein [Methanoculleus sp. Wushi-C6]|uniref:histidine kinase n=1 Tax=Methanoculleus caldifontis TaxID=2651577 RepID=A0ABU3X3K1_9EURY|nr:ATP-binding protein [Methanoculleus sp. Wushi-C6]MDV2482640.1 PAS domain S-box protein [Methanoculleus sp. Wushi-C6]
MNALRLPREEELLRVLEELYGGFTEAEETLSAIRRGEVDAFLVSTDEGEKVYTLSTAEHPYRVLVEQMREGAATLSTDGTILYSNESFARLLGMPLQNLIGESIHAFVAPAGAEGFRGMMEDGDPSGTTGESMLLAHGRDLVPVYLSLKLLQMDGVQVYSLVATDLTGQKRSEELLRRAYAELEDRVKERTAELAVSNSRLREQSEDLVRLNRALRESEERLEMALDAADLAPWEIDLVTGRMTASEALAGLLGAPGPSALQSGTDWMAFVVQEDRAGILQALKTVVAGNGEYRAEYRIHRPSDGSTRWILSQGLVRRDLEGQAHRLVGVAADVTEQKRAEEERARLHSELESAHRETNLYLDILTHDIGNTENVSNLYADLLLGILDGEAAGYVEKLQRSIRKSIDILGTVSKIRRIHSGTPDIRPIDLDEVIQNEIRRYHDGNIRYDGHPGLVMADDLLPEVFANLIGNAVKHGGPGVAITVRTEDADGLVRVVVEDTGRGVPDADKEAIFHRYEQKRRGVGEGLGLYLVRILVERYGGEIWVEDRIPGRPGCGAAFWFTLRKT